MMFPMPCKQKRDELCPPACRALYLHVPFCVAKCRYCDFYSVAHDPAAAGAYVAAARAELDARRDCLAPPLASVFVGGGTPTTLGAEPLGELLATFRALIDEHTEVTVEANPAALGGGLGPAMLDAGVNRVNLGVQSFQDDELGVLGRAHLADEARRALATLRAAGFRNVGLDLIYGIPGQTGGSWQASVDEAIAMGCEHLSCYALSFEEPTPLAADLRAGRVAEMPDALQEQCYRHAVAACERAGMEHYEVSNFARPGRACRHNLTYWHNEPYLGIGPGAASYLDGVRRTNRPDVAAYAAAALAGCNPPATEERLTGAAAMAETVMLALRMTDGLDRAGFADRYGCDVTDAFPRSIARYAELGALEVTGRRVRIASWARFVGDTVLADIVAEGQPSPAAE